MKLHLEFGLSDSSAEWEERPKLLAGIYIRLGWDVVNSSSYMMTAGFTRCLASRLATLTALCLELFLLPLFRLALSLKGLPMPCLLVLGRRDAAALAAPPSGWPVGTSQSKRWRTSEPLYVVGIHIWGIPFRMLTARARPTAEEPPTLMTQSRSVTRSTASSTICARTLTTAESRMCESRLGISAWI